MKKPLLFLLFIFYCTNSLFSQKQNDALWNQVKEYEVKELPKSALQIVDRIYTIATREKNSNQIIKSLIYKSKFSLILNKNAPLSIVQDFKKQIDNSTFPTKNILNNLLGNLYWQYFQKNRYQFYNRTRTTKKIDSIDFRTWDINTLFKEAHVHYQNAFINKNELAKTNVTLFKDIMQLKKDSEIYRPTLYDFLANNALTFYKTPEHSITKPTFQFKLDSKKYLANAATFAKLETHTKDSLSLQFNALKIYQDLIRIHLKDADKRALSIINIDRLKFVSANSSNNIDKNDFLNALVKAKKEYANNEVSALYDFEIATIYFNQSNKDEQSILKKVAALKICNKALQQFPNSFGAKKCETLKAIIEQKSLTIRAEEHIPTQANSRLLVNYKNIENLYFNAYKITLEEQEKLNKTYNIDAIISFIKRLEKVSNWQIKLRNENDYKEHSTEVIVPKFDHGNYIILASEHKEFDADKLFGTATIQVTNLALIENEINGKYRYQVVNRNTGKPIQNATITIKNPKRTNSGPIHKNLITDRNGFASFKSKYTYYKCEISVQYKNEKAYFGTRSLYQIASIKQQKKNRAEDNAEIILRPYIFTDRSIYRPGQTIYFKAIVLKKQGEKSEVFTNEYIEVVLYDSNNQVVKSLDLKLNAFGSVMGEFKIPNNGLTGKFLIEVDESAEKDSNFYEKVDFDFDYDRSTQIQVEEYKRPKFKADFKPITESYIINDSVTVNGFAKSFAGANITDAKVSYKIIRKIQYPSWYYWRNSYNTNATREIGFGETKTNHKGEFNIVFKALADDNVSKENLPTFTYEITADVTDINGETRSNNTTIKVGYHALSVQLNVPVKIDKTSKVTKLKITTKNLNGEFIASKGTLKIHKLIAPKNPLRRRAWDAPDYQNISEEKFRRIFPNEPYTQEETNENNWKKGKLAFETQFDTAKEKEIILSNLKKWASGKYIATVNTKDKFGFNIKEQQRFGLFSYKEKTIADNKLFFIQTDKTFHTPKDKVNLKLSSASKNITVTLQIEKDHKIKKTILVHLNNESKIIKIPVKKKDLGGFSIKYHFVNYNSFVKGNLAIQVPKQEKQLQILTNIFRNKLQPGQNQTWSFTIKDDKNNAIATEVLASMYDASLDEFKTHNWTFSPTPEPESYYSYNNTNSNYSFGTENFRIRNKQNYYANYPSLQYNSYNWFGLSLNSNRWKAKQYLRKLKRSRETQKTTKSGNYTGVISGVISDDSGVLPGVSVVVKGTTLGTETDFDGNFQIKAKKGDVLTFSYLGYTTVEITVGSFSKINIYLEEDSNVLDEVVVTALGIKREKQSLGFAMQGKISGVKILNEEKLLKKITSVKARKNFNETAFFYPELRTDRKGQIRFNFTIPEALTKWKLQLLAHTKHLETATKSLTTITQKELMVIPNAPRFLRQGDSITFSAKISNLTNNQLSGIAQLQLTDAVTGKEIDIDLNNIEKTKNFTVDKDGNTNVFWRLTIPASIQTVQYKIVATSGDFSDGEQNVLPVLSNRELVTETMPIWVRSNQTKTFTLEKLKNNTSKTLKNHKLTLEMTSNPAWNAIQALPYLMEYPFDCAEQTFSKFYANSLASYIANSNPKIKEVFNSWKSSKTLISNLEKNQELKSLIIQETPWLRDAQSDTKQKQRIGLLFDLNRIKNEKERTINKLKDIQLGNGGFPWFKGSDKVNQYITQHIASGFGHLKKIGITKFKPATEKIFTKAVQYLDTQILKKYLLLLKRAKTLETQTKVDGKKAAEDYLKSNHLGYSELQYLYMRSFYTSLDVTNKLQQEAIHYFLNQSVTYWQEFNLYGKGQIALINFRSGQKNVANDILKSLKEHSITTDELGMYWKNNTSGYYFYQSQVETQALLIETFSEIENNTETLDNLKIWLLKNKQTNRWKTTKSTTEAVYALLLNGSDWLSVTDMVAVTVGGDKIDSLRLKDTNIEAGSGYYKTSWNNKEITPNHSEVKIVKKGKGIAWGGLYWQYFEDLDKIAFSESPLSIDKKLFLKINTASGKELTEITKNTHLKIGDLITVRIEIRSDRNMEFIHMKDMRAAGLEPINVLSSYKWKDGLGYYQSTKDASTNFFFDVIPKGVYVFEYDLRVNNAGSFSNGITTIQSMYAPEFSSHSKGIRIHIK